MNVLKLFTKQETELGWLLRLEKVKPCVARGLGCFGVVMKPWGTCTRNRKPQFGLVCLKAFCVGHMQSFLGPLFTNMCKVLYWFWWKISRSYVVFYTINHDVCFQPWVFGYFSAGDDWFLCLAMSLLEKPEIRVLWRSFGYLKPFRCLEEFSSLLGRCYQF